MASKPEKHTTYFELVEALKRPPVCGLCRLAAETAHRYLDTLLYENVNDAGARARLRASGGMCDRHGRELLTFRDGLGTSLLYRDQMDEAIAWLGRSPERPPRWPRWRREQSMSHSPCPVCEQENGASRLYVEAIPGFLSEPELQAAFEEGAGLCLPHLRLALAACPDSACREFLVTLHRRKYEHLQHELDEFIRKSDYRFADETYGSERDAWRRAVHTVQGWFFPDIDLDREKPSP